MTEEDRIQMAVVLWVNLKYPDLIFTMAPVGVKIGSKIEKMRVGRKNKQLGYRKGWPDLFFAEPRGGFHGLFIELKTKTGRLSPEQRTILVELDSLGYKCAVTRTQMEAIHIIDDYMKGAV